MGGMEIAAILMAHNGLSLFFSCNISLFLRRRPLMNILYLFWYLACRVGIIKLQTDMNTPSCLGKLHYSLVVRAQSPNWLAMSMSPENLTICQIYASFPRSYGTTLRVQLDSLTQFLSCFYSRASSFVGDVCLQRQCGGAEKLECLQNAKDHSWAARLHGPCQNGRLAAL